MRQLRLISLMTLQNWRTELWKSNMFDEQNALSV